MHTHAELGKCAKHTPDLAGGIALDRAAQVLCGGADPNGRARVGRVRDVGDAQTNDGHRFPAELPRD